MYIIYSINYIIIRENGFNFLHQNNFFEYKFNFFTLIINYLITVPFISYILQKSFNKIFSMLVSILLIIGVLPGIIVYSFSNNESNFLFIILFVYLPFIFTIINRRRITTKTTKNKDTNGIITMNERIFKFVGFIGVLIYIYISIKYFKYLNFNPFSNIYIQRELYNTIVTGIDGYLILFAKNLSTYCLLIIAVLYRNIYIIFLIFFIFIIDFFLGAHKASIFSIIFVFLYYLYVYKINFEKYYYLIILYVISIISFVLILTIYYFNNFSFIILGLYDRVFHTTSGLFARIYEYCNEFYFFRGGTGLLGKIFDGVDKGLSSTKEIGSYYFSDGVQSNVNFISDGYLNFGIIGSFFQIFILWSLFNNKDDFICKKYFFLLFPLVLMYAKLLTSISIQTSLLSGGMIIFVIIIKYGFKIKYI